MSRLTFSDDFLAVCLLLAEGNLHLSLRELNNRANQFQEEHDSYFGDSGGDFREALVMLAYHYRGHYDLELDFPLWPLIPTLLDFREVYCNDEGCDWNKGNEPASQEEFDKTDLAYFSNLKWEEYCRKATTKQAMLKLFAQGACPKPEQVLGFLASAGYDSSLLGEPIFRNN